jgi:hypothetical protein
VFNIGRRNLPNFGIPIKQMIIANVVTIEFNFHKWMMYEK